MNDKKPYYLPEGYGDSRPPKPIHRVKISIPKESVKCPLRCDRAENCYRCNDYYEKCNIYKNTIIDKF